MERIINFEQVRMVFIAGAAPAMAILSPTQGFVQALIIMFAFNMWAGMRADGVSIVRCKNFKWKKFRGALAELLLYLLILETIHSIMVNCGDGSAAIYLAKSLTYVFLYVYAQNSFRNLLIAYPKNPALHIVYHIIRLEFHRLMPRHWKPIIDRYEKQHESSDTGQRSREQHGR